MNGFDIALASIALLGGSILVGIFAWELIQDLRKDK